MMRSVLVTGATTPLGSMTVRGLLDDHVETVVAVGLEPKSVLLPQDPRVHYEQVDLSRPRQVRRLLFGPARDLAVDTVIHAAPHRDPRDEGTKIHALSVESTRLLLTESERHPTIRRLVYRSHGEVYRLDTHLPNLIGEDHPLELSPRAPQWARDRVEADLTVCSRMGMSPVRIIVLRCAEIMAPETGSQLWDYLQSNVCLRPLGFNPILNLLTPHDAVRALVLASRSQDLGVFNIPGADTLPLSRLIKYWNRRQIPVPGPLISPLYRLRSAVVGTQFRYDLNAKRFHFSGVLDGERAARVLGYRPQCRIDWPSHPPPSPIIDDPGPMLPRGPETVTVHH